MQEHLHYLNESIPEIFFVSFVIIISDTFAEPLGYSGIKTTTSVVK